MNVVGSCNMCVYLCDRYPLVMSRLTIGEVCNAGMGRGGGGSGREGGGGVLASCNYIR